MLAPSAQLVNRFRDELFAGARFAVHQHGRRGWGGLLDDAIDRPQGRRVPDHLAEPSLLVELMPQARDVAQRALPFGDMSKQCSETLGVDRLRQVVVRTFLHR